MCNLLNLALWHDTLAVPDFDGLPIRSSARIWCCFEGNLVGWPSTKQEVGVPLKVGKHSERAFTIVCSQWKRSCWDFWYRVVWTVSYRRFIVFGCALSQSAGSFSEWRLCVDEVVIFLWRHCCIGASMTMASLFVNIWSVETHLFFIDADDTKTYHVSFLFAYITHPKFVHESIFISGW